MKPNLKNNRGTVAAMIVLASVVSSQCSKASTAPTSPTAVAAGASSTMALGSVVSSAPTLTEIRVCRVGNVSGTVALVLTPVTQGTGNVLTPITLAPGECRTAAIDTGGDKQGSLISVTDQAQGLVSAIASRNDAGKESGPTAFTNGSSRFLNSFHGHTITFTNQVVVNTGNEGCTPGYWKQSQHLDSWVGYLPGADFDATFVVSFFNPDRTLWQALGQGGGGPTALGRHAVAALLNTSNSGVAYPYTEAQVLDIVQGDGAYLGLNFTQRKNLLEAANEKGCPLN